MIERFNKLNRMERVAIVGWVIALVLAALSATFGIGFG